MSLSLLIDRLAKDLRSMIRYITRKEGSVSIPKFYPHASMIVEPEATINKRFKPSGLTIHYTAGIGVSGTLNALRKKRLCYHLIIDRDGRVIQAAVLNHSVSHAGRAKWRGRSPNGSHVAIALVSWGELKLDRESGDFLSWSGKKVAEDEVAKRPSNLKPVPYFWHKITEAQIESLLQCCLYFIECGIDPADICGHDEAALPTGRKIDPGGTLPWTMSELRALLEKKANQELEIS